MVRGLYRAAMGALAAGAATVSALPGVPRRWRVVGDRLGRLGSAERAIAVAAPVFWVHAASVGELTAVRPLVSQLRLRFPGRAIVLSTLTRTGLELARSVPEAHLALLLPLDAPRVVGRLLRGVRVEAFFFTETEIWPTWLERLGTDGVPTFMVSGRVSERTLRRAMVLRPLYRLALADVTCCMQTEEDAARIVALGAAPVRVHVAGSLKFDAAPEAMPDEVRRLGDLAADGGRRIVVAGSTHEGEEAAVLEAYDRVVRGHRDVILLLAPRHPERSQGVAELVAAGGLPLLRYREATERAALPAGPLVVLLDGVGLLAHCYGIATLAFVGGSLVPIGGHNVLEPARVACPIVVGPHTENARDLVDRMLAARGALRVESAAALAWTIDHLLASPEEARAIGRRAQALVQTGQGAVERHMKIIASRLTRASFVRDGAD